MEFQGSQTASIALESIEKAGPKEVTRFVVVAVFVGKSGWLCGSEESQEIDKMALDALPVRGTRSRFHPHCHRTLMWLFYLPNFALRTLIRPY